MKKIFAFLFLITLTLSSQTKVIDERTGIPIVFTVSADCFPPDWRGGEIKGKAMSLDTSEILRTTKLIKKAMAKYPRRVLVENIKIIYAFKSLTFFGQAYGGTNSNDNLYIANSGLENGYDSIYIEKTFHHEFSSMLFRNYPNYFHKKDWLSNNSGPYGNGGINALKENKTNQDLDTVLCARGFIHQYGTSDLENDINSFAENLFLSDAPFWNAVSKYPALKKKSAILILFYYKIDRVFTVEYFMTFREKVK